MKEFQNYVESPYFDMRNPYSFDRDFGCGCNPCKRPNYPSDCIPKYPPIRPPENCFPPPKCPNFNNDCDELLYLLTGILIGKKWQ